MNAEETTRTSRALARNVRPDWTMTGKRVLFTGASRGMAHFAALELAKLGAKVLVVGHNDARGTAAVEAIRRAGGSAEFLPADMGDADDVCALAAAVLRRGEPLTAEIAARPAAAPAQAVIVIPAGMPHRIWNSSPTPVRYLDADVPVPKAYARLAPAP